MLKTKLFHPRHSLLLVNLLQKIHSYCLKQQNQITFHSQCYTLSKYSTFEYRFKSIEDLMRRVMVRRWQMTNSQLRLCVFISWYLIYIHARPSIVQSDLHDLGKKNVEDDEVEHLKSSNKRLLIRTSNKNILNDCMHLQKTYHRSVAIMGPNSNVFNQSRYSFRL